MHISAYSSITKPDFAEAFALVRKHAAEDTVMRKTDRTGHETRGKRSVECGGNCSVPF